MSDDPRIQRLLDELFETQATPEEVCRSSPELLPEIRERWRQMSRVQKELDTLFPPHSQRPGNGSPEGTPLPDIPGYEMISILGRGGMGVVFRAKHLRLNRVVALKMALAGAYSGPLERERFQREAEAVAALRHPNIVQIYDLGDSEGRPYFTMEFVEGGSLAEKNTGQPQPARPAAALIGTLAKAVDAAHRTGVVHRDLKPANILLGVDGTPKISDFGLAQRLDDRGRLTHTRAPIGTPSYMAPEQACGKDAEVGPAADIHALGVLLYERLTGRPPFEGETVAETLLRVIHHDPLPPSKLNTQVPRDLEIICLTCLQKTPQLRYATAAALADDIDRFLQGEAIAARPEGTLQRLIRRVRRRPALTAAWAVGATLALALIGVGLWVSAENAEAERRQQSQQVALERATDEDLRDMVRHLRTSSWPEARAAQERARGRLGQHKSVELRGRLDEGIHELELASRLESIRLGRAARLGKKASETLSDKEYETAFGQAGLGHVADSAAVVAQRVGTSNIHRALLAALDDWASCTTDPGRQNWLLQVARDVMKQREHPDPAGWFERARDVEVWSDKAALARLVDITPVDDVSIPLQLALAERLRVLGADPVPFLKRIQQAHPGDFWANLNLAEGFMEKNDLREAIRYYQAAIAARPDAAVVYDDLGLALALLGRMDEADDQFREAATIDPTATEAHRHLGIVFSTLARRDETLDVANFPRHFNHRVASLHAILGDELRDAGKLDVAMDRYRQAIALDPKVTAGQYGIRSIFTRQGRLEDAWRAWEKAIDAAPPEHAAWDGYAELCLFLGKEAEYRRVREMLLARFGLEENSHVAERTGRACLLMPGSAEEQASAEILVQRALAAEPDQPYYQFAKGLAEYRGERLDSAISLLTGPASTVMGPTPRLIKAMAEFRQGKAADARKTLAAAVLSCEWPPAPDHRDDWIAHALRREAENLLLPNLSAFLVGNYRPRDNEERFALLDGCRYMNRPSAMIDLYVDIFNAEPAQADDLRAGHRYAAARAAALAGCGRREDAASLGEVDRVRWRQQARQWLRADLAAWGAASDGTPEARTKVWETLTGWRNEPDLAGLREPATLDRMSAEERQEWLSLWSEVQAILDRTPRP